MVKKLLTATEVAKAAGLTRQSIYFYEGKGLIEPAVKTDSGHRLYSTETVERINQIQGMKNDYRLTKIKQLIDTGEVK